MNHYDTDRLNEAEARAEAAEEELKVCQERLKEAEEREAQLAAALVSCFTLAPSGGYFCPRCGNDTRRHAADCIVGKALTLGA